MSTEKTKTFNARLTQAEANMLQHSADIKDLSLTATVVKAVRLTEQLDKEDIETIELLARFAKVTSGELLALAVRDWLKSEAQKLRGG